MHDEATQTLNGRRTRQSFRLTQDVTVRLKEASPVTGGLVFEMCLNGNAGRRAPERGLERPASAPFGVKPGATADSKAGKSGKRGSGGKRGRR
jgi:ribonuclease R